MSDAFEWKFEGTLDHESARALRGAFLRDMFFSRAGWGGYFTLAYTVLTVCIVVFAPHEFGMGALCGFTAGVAFTCFLGMIRLYVSFGKTLKPMQTNPTRYVVDESSLSATSRDGSRRIAWETVRNVRAYRGCAILRIEGGMRYLIATKIMPAEALAFLLRKPSAVAAEGSATANAGKM